MSRLDFLSFYIDMEFFYLLQGVLLTMINCFMLVKTPWVLRDGSTVIGW
jgi:hypothetical protein